MQNDGGKYTLTVRGFNQSAGGDFCGEAEKSRDKFGTAPTFFVRECKRNHNWTVRIMSVQNRNGSDSSHVYIFQPPFYNL
jgi:hypothetical protein